ncbi:DUF1501 domain-containing protein [Thalassoglobus neptunius]|uniref:DUF1501 domain-containing protein n=1 Tax=Thalassoglobus neptunius TaxID=1938619 RepID=UPI0011B82EE8|nr:DUF1501 domain-containing protein [Thalassoglobus neptunius]
MSHKSSGQPSNPVSRRNFLAVGGVSIATASLRDSFGGKRSQPHAVIQIIQNGGASHLDTLDPKPDAAREIRGPSRAISTEIPGVHFAESFPELARRANELVVLRSLHHDLAPIHETGLQLLRSGDHARRGQHPLDLGIALSQLLRPNGTTPLAVRISETDITPKTSVKQDDSPTPNNEATSSEPPVTLSLPTLKDIHQRGFAFEDSSSQNAARTKRAYGETHFGELLWTAARLVEAGVRYVEVHTFENLEGQLTWDAHGCRKTSPATVFTYRDELGPRFDRAVGGLIDDLKETGLWNQTLVVSAGEMGRTPRINETAGRDHWPHVFSGFLAGGGLKGGQVIGASDATGESIINDPIPLNHLPGLICNYFGIDESESLELPGFRTWSPPPMESSLTASC